MFDFEIDLKVLLVLFFVIALFSYMFSSIFRPSFGSVEKIEVSSSLKNSPTKERLAKELVNRTFPEDIDMAADYCRGLEKPGNCLYWLSFYTGVEAAPDYKLAREKCLKIGREEMGGCFDGFGWGTARHFKNAEEAIKVCKEGKSQYKNACLDGVAGGLGIMYYDNATKMRKQCKYFDSSTDEFRDNRRRCYDGFGQALALKYYGQPERINSSCNSAEQGYKRWCFKAVGYSLAQHYENELKRIRMNCQKFGQYNYTCLLGVGDALGEYMTLRNVSLAENVCERIGQRSLVENCVEEIGYALGRSYLHDVEKGIDGCEKLKERNTLTCLRGFKKTIKRRYESREKYFEKCELLEEADNRITC